MMLSCATTGLLRKVTWVVGINANAPAGTGAVAGLLGEGAVPGLGALPGVGAVPGLGAVVEAAGVPFLSETYQAAT